MSPLAVAFGWACERFANFVSKLFGGFDRLCRVGLGSVMKSCHSERHNARPGNVQQLKPVAAPAAVGCGCAVATPTLPTLTGKVGHAAWSLDQARPRHTHDVMCALLHGKKRRLVSASVQFCCFCFSADCQVPCPKGLA